MQQAKDKINEAKRKSQTPVVGNMDPLLDALNQISQHEYTKKKEIGRLVYKICMVFHFFIKGYGLVFQFYLPFLHNYCPDLLFLKLWNILKQLIPHAQF